MKLELRNVILVADGFPMKIMVNPNEISFLESHKKPKGDF